MKVSQATLDWLLDSDPSLRWQVERDLLGLPDGQWQTTRELTSTQGNGAALLALQDTDGQWAGGAFFPKRHIDNVVRREGDETGQPFLATTWSLNALREWGVDPARLGDTAKRIEANCRWEYDDLPYWDGEVDVCINSYTLANGAWLRHDVSGIATWFTQHQLEDGGWNCEWVEGSTRSSFHSTLNALIGILEYEKLTGTNAELAAARKRGEEYLLERSLMYRLETGEPVGDWVNQYGYPNRWRYSTLRALDYFRAAAEFENNTPDARLSEAVTQLRSAVNERGRWLNQRREKGEVWFNTDAEVGDESRWITFYALRVLNWWEAAASA
jgi:hypothetical protein